MDLYCDVLEKQASLVKGGVKMDNSLRLSLMGAIIILVLIIGAMVLETGIKEVKAIKIKAQSQMVLNI